MISFGPLEEENCYIQLLNIEGYKYIGFPFIDFHSSYKILYLRQKPLEDIYILFHLIDNVIITNFKMNGLVSALV